MRLPISDSAPLHSEPYSTDARGIRVPHVPATHRDEEYDQSGFRILLDMQDNHFWYRGRHRFLLHSLRQSLRFLKDRKHLGAVDLGGGCGGWLRYLQRRMPHAFGELALADSSPVALELAESVVGKSISRYQIDLLNLGWRERWDVAFLLDVLEHIPHDEEVLRQIFTSLRPGGLLIVACPALQIFWSYNDVVAHHCRRYSRDDFHRLGQAAGFEIVRTRYFQFFLSPLYYLSRLMGPKADSSAEIARAAVEKAHQVPIAPINLALTAAFSLETPLAWNCPFPWGTSVLGVFRRPTE